MHATATALYYIDEKLEWFIEARETAQEQIMDLLIESPQCASQD